MIDLKDSFSFCHMYWRLYINFYVQAGQFDKAKPHLRTLANEMAQYMKFYDSLRADRRQALFSQDYQATVSGIRELTRIAGTMNDPDFANEMQQILGPYTTQQIQD